MSNVPSHTRTRRTHRHGLAADGGSRPSHRQSGYLDAIEGAAEVYEQVSVDEAGQITAGQISPGAVTGAAFASTVAPVLLVHGLPTLPNPAYPVDTFVYDIDAVPKSLWKNVADVWTRAIGPDDIQANSITAGQIAAGAVSTSELAVGARLTGEVANETGSTPGVFIDSTGILIRDGKMTLEDEFGQTTMEASGFAGTWSEFVKLGLYNARFLAGLTGTVINGRTVALPYWTASDPNAGGTLTMMDDGAGNPSGRLKFTFGNNLDEKMIVSDPIPMAGASSYEYGLRYDTTKALNAVFQVRCYYEVSDDPTFASSSSSTVLAVLEGTGVGSTGTVDAVDRGVDSLQARYGRLVIKVMALSGHVAGDEFVLREVWFKESPSVLGAFTGGGSSNPISADQSVDPAVVLGGGVNNVRVDVDTYFEVLALTRSKRLALDGVASTTATGTRADTNIGLATVLRFSGAAAVTYTGFTCNDQTEGRIIILRNASSQTFTLKHNDAASVTTNRILTPGAVDFTLAANASVMLMYDATSSRWYVVSK